MAMVVVRAVKGRLAGIERKLMATVRKILVSQLGIPADDPLVCLEEIQEGHILAPARMREVTIFIYLFTGRTVAQKRDLYAAITDNLGQMDIPPSDTLILLCEQPAENWGVAGVPASDAFDVTSYVDGGKGRNHAGN
jgi:4-oxalocrotonate tautomerase